MSGLALAIATKGEWDAEQLLKELGEAGLPPSTEVHVACDARHAPVNAPQGIDIHARANASLFELWAVAIEGSTAPWIAILHADALPAPGWFAAMEHAIRREQWRDGYWGPVEPKFASSDKRMAGYLTEYCQFHRPLAPDLIEVPGSNLVLPRQRIGISSNFSKTKLLGQGLAPNRVENAVVLYARPFELGEYCKRRFRHGRAYAAARTPQLSLLRAAPLSVVLPFIRTARVLRQAWRHQALRGASLRWLPVILLAESFWSAGELTGYFTRRPGDPSALD